MAGRVRVLDIGTGTGALAVEAVRAGASQVTAVDVSWQAVMTARFNTRVRRLPVRVKHGDGFLHADGQTWDLLLANPPYVPAQNATVPQRGRARAWDAGIDGRAVLDQLCITSAHLLNTGGVLLLVQSALAGVDTSLEQLRSSGLEATVVARQHIPFGPVMRGRLAMLRRRGLVAPEASSEELVVIRGDKVA